MTRKPLAIAVAFFCTATPTIIVAENRAPINADSVAQLERLGSREEGISFLGPHATSGQLLVETRHKTTVFDDKAQGFTAKFERSISIFDDTTLEKMKTLDRVGWLSSVTQDGKKRLWSQPGGRKFAFSLADSKSQNTCTVKGYDANVAGSAFHPTKDLVAVNVWEFDPEEVGCRIGFSNIRLFRGDGKLVRQFANANGGGAWLQFSPNGDSLAVANRNAKYTQLIDLKTGKERHRFPSKGYTRSVDFHPSGKMIALFGPKHFQVWDTESGKSIHTMELKNQAGGGEVLWSPEGDMLIVAYEGKVTFLETETWAKKHELKLRHPRVSNVMLTPDGARLITASWEQTWLAEEWMVESWGVKVRDEE